MKPAMPNDLKLEEITSAMDQQIRVCAAMYMHIARETMKQFGVAGEMTVRHGLRELGTWRAQEMRAAHHALGLPLNMQTLMQQWDNASTFLVKDDMESDGRFRPCDVRFNVPYCPAAAVWKAAGFLRWGHVYCDEFHQACASSYHPDGNVVIPRNLMKGDAYCHFRWVMPPNAVAPDPGEPTGWGRKLARDYDPSNPLEDAWMTLRRSNRLLAGFLIALGRTVLDRHGDAGCQVLRGALARWGHERGVNLRNRHIAAAMEPTAAHFFQHHDLPVRQVWAATLVESEAHRTVFEVQSSPQDDALDDYDAGDLSLLLYDESYPAMVAAYLPGASAEWAALKARGDATNRLELDQMI